MTVQLALNLPTSAVDVSENKTSFGTDNHSKESGFSGQLDKKINQLNDQRKVPSKGEVDSKKVSENQGVSETVEAVDSKALPDVEERNKPTTVNVALELNSVEDVVLNSAAPVVETAQTVAANVVAGFESKELPHGKELPLVDQLKGDFQQDKSTDIVFDPLKDFNNNVVQAPVVLTDLRNQQKIKFNGSDLLASYAGKTNEFFNLAGVNEVQPSAKLFKNPGLLGTGDVNSLNQTTAQTPLSSINTTAGNVSQQQLLTPSLDSKPSLVLDTPVNSPKWANDFGQKVQWMVNQSVSGAQIRLNPQHLGPIEVRVQVQNDQATISFTAQHGATREAIDSALPRLREMLSDQQVALLDVNVSQHSFAEQQQKQLSDDSNTELANDNSASDLEDDIFTDDSTVSEPIYEGLFNKYA